MKKQLAIAAFAATMLSGCATVQTPLFGGLFTSVKAPVDSENVAPVNKAGKACATSILGLIALGDASIEKAKRDSGIANVATVDTSATSFLTLYGRYCTIITGN